MAKKQNQQPDIRIVETRVLPLSMLEPNNGQIDGLPANPRDMVDKDFKKLKKSITDNPEMLGLRELLVYPHGNGKYIVIGGNMRMLALMDLGYFTAPCKILPEETTPEQMQAYVIKDNVGYGQWNWDMLANEWDSNLLEEWGVSSSWEMPSDEDEQTDSGVSAIEDDFDEDKDCIEVRCKPGDVWQLGEHRLMCGDSIKLTDVQRLMGGVKQT